MNKITILALELLLTGATFVSTVVAVEGYEDVSEQHTCYVIE